MPSAGRPPGEVLRIAHRALELGHSPVELAGQGAHLVEIDVRVRGDGELVVRHNPGLPRDLPLLEPALADVAGAGLGAYLDVKSLTPAAGDLLAPMIERVGLAQRCIVASADPELVPLLPQHLPRAVLFAAVDVDPVSLAATTGAQFVHPCWERLDAPHEQLRWLPQVRDQGLGVISWHEERSRVLRALLDLGVDGICTDDMPTLTAMARGRPAT